MIPLDPMMILNIYSTLACLTIWDQGYSLLHAKDSFVSMESWQEKGFLHCSSLSMCNKLAIINQIWILHLACKYLQINTEKFIIVWMSSISIILTVTILRYSCPIPSIEARRYWAKRREAVLKKCVTCGVFRKCMDSQDLLFISRSRAVDMIDIAE